MNTFEHVLFYHIVSTSVYEFFPQHLGSWVGRLIGDGRSRGNSQFHGGMKFLDEKTTGKTLIDDDRKLQMFHKFISLGKDIFVSKEQILVNIEQKKPITKGISGKAKHGIWPWKC